MLVNLFFNTGGVQDFKYKKLDMYDPAIEDRNNQALINGGLEDLVLPKMVREKNKLNINLPTSHKYIVAIDPGTSKLGFCIGTAEMEYPYLLAVFKRDNARIEEKGESSKFRENFREFFRDFMEINKGKIKTLVMESPFDNYMKKKSKSTYPILKAIFDDLRTIALGYGVEVLKCSPSQWKSYFLRDFGRPYLISNYGIYDVNLSKANKDIIFLLATCLFKDLKLHEENEIQDACDAMGILWYGYSLDLSHQDGTIDNPYTVIKSMDRCYRHKYQYRFTNANSTMDTAKAIQKATSNPTQQERPIYFVTREPNLSLEDNIRSMTTKFPDAIFISAMTESIDDLREVLIRRELDNLWKYEDVFAVYYR